MKDLSGIQFNQWLVLEFGYIKYDKYYWLCKCSCGNIKYISGWSLTHNGSHKCKSCVAKDQRIDITNQRFGHYIAKKYIGKNKWECICDCGRVRNVHSNFLRNERSSSCKYCINRKYCGKISGKFFSNFRSYAKKRDIEFNITKEYLWELLQKQEEKCALSNIKLIITDSTKDYESGKGTLSLDRIDSSKGYIDRNVQFVHKDINIMKWDLPQNRFIELCNLVSSFNHKFPELNYKFPIGKYLKSNTIIPGFVINAIKNGANVRNIDFDLTNEFLFQLFKKQGGRCALTGLELKFAYCMKDRSFTTASLDRIDNNIDYMPDNVQWVHKDVNNIKRHYSQQYVIEMCKLVNDNFMRKNNDNS